MKKYILIPVILFIASLTTFICIFSFVWEQRTDVSVVEETLFGDKEAVKGITLSVTEELPLFDRHIWNIQFSPADTNNAEVSYVRNHTPDITTAVNDDGEAELRIIQPNLESPAGQLSKNSQKLFGKMVEETMNTSPKEIVYNVKEYQKTFRLKDYLDYLPLTLTLSVGDTIYGYCYLHTDSIRIPVPESASAEMQVQTNSGKKDYCYLSYDMDINQKGIITGSDAYFAVAGFSDGSAFPEEASGIYHLPVKEINGELSADRKELRKLCPLPADEMPMALKESTDGKNLLLFAKAQDTLFLTVISKDDGSLLQKLSLGTLTDPEYSTAIKLLSKDDSVLLILNSGQFFFLENRGDKYSLFTSGSLADHNVMTLNEMDYISYSHSAFAYINNKLYLMIRTYYNSHSYLFCYDEKGAAYAGRFTPSLYTEKVFSSRVPQPSLGNTTDASIQKEK